MKHKVRVFNAKYDCETLEERINQWLEDHENIAIVDIKYGVSQCGNSGGAIYYNYSAIVHYMED